MSTLRVNNMTNVGGTGSTYAVGHVVQVVSGVYSGGEIGNSSTTYADTNVTATITPKFTTSKILVVINGNYLKNNSNTGNGLNVRILRDATVVKTVTGLGVTNTTMENNGAYSVTYLDSPATTNAITYKTQFANAVASSVVIHGRGHEGTITLMEVAA